MQMDPHNVLAMLWTGDADISANPLITEISIRRSEASKHLRV